MAAIDDLVEDLKQTHGLALEFDDQGRCVLEHADDFEILVALRNDSRVISISVVVSYIVIDEPTLLFAELLKQNLTNHLAGAFYFAIDGAASRVLLTSQARVDKLSAESFATIVRLLATARERVGAIVDAAQADGETLDHVIAELEAEAPHADGTDAPPPGQFI
jgi:hypothetical protein